MNPPRLVSLLLMLLAAGPRPAVAAEKWATRNLARGGFGGLQETNQTVLRDPKAWAELWTKNAVEAKAVKTVPFVDFSTEMVVAVALGRQRSGGYLVEITTVETSGDKLRVTYRRKGPPPDSIVAQLVTTPYHFVAVPRSDRKAEFVEAPR